MRARRAGSRNPLRSCTPESCEHWPQSTAPARVQEVSVAAIQEDETESVGVPRQQKLKCHGWGHFAQPRRQQPLTHTLRFGLAEDARQARRSYIDWVALTSISAFKTSHFNAVNDEGTPFDVSGTPGRPLWRASADHGVMRFARDNGLPSSSTVMSGLRLFCWQMYSKISAPASHRSRNPAVHGDA
jgi:hypothetical protein